MIECEVCGNFFHVDEIEECPKCGRELCPSCYEKHVTACMLDTDEPAEQEMESTIPHICPDCGHQLHLDLEPDGSARVYCEQCDYVQELNVEQLAELQGDEDQDEFFEDQDEEGYDGSDGFTCPECGRTFAPDDYENGDAGNGFCRNCAPNH